MEDTTMSIKGINELLEKLVIAFKLKWRAAARALKSKIYSFLHSDVVNKDNQINNTYEAAYKYSLTYSIPEYIEEMLNDVHDIFKQIGSDLQHYTRLSQYFIAF